MLVSHLDWLELQARLCGPGLAIRTGPFVNRIRSRLAVIAEGIALLYADFSLAGEDEFVDHTVTVNPVRGLPGSILGRSRVLIRGEQGGLFGRFASKLGLSYLEWGLNNAIYREPAPYLLLHAAVLERGGRALLIIGDSGAGKSTLCSALMLSGWRLLSDELGLVSLDDGLLSALARPVSLKNDSIAAIRAFAPAVLMSTPHQSARKGLLAHLKPPTESVRRMNERAEPAWIVLVRHEAGAPFTVEDVPRSRSFAAVLRSGLNYSNLGEVGFRQACHLVDRCECRSVRYSQLADALAHFESASYRAR